ATAGMHVRIAGPEGYLPGPSIVEKAKQRAQQTGGSIQITTDANVALDNADVVVTDTWISMGQENETEARLKLFKAYAVDATAMDHAADAAIFLHCLPASRGYEVSSDVIAGRQSSVLDEAETRLHAQNAVVACLVYASNLAEIPESVAVPQAEAART